jgi:ectoine hydroxylase
VRRQLMYGTEATTGWVTSGTHDAPVELQQLDAVDSVDFASFAANRLTDAERESFARTGYLVIRDVLPPEQHVRLKQLILELREQKIAEGWHPEEDLVQAVFSPLNSLQLDPAVRQLLTQHKIFPKVVDILGANIYCYHSYLSATRAAPPSCPIPSDYSRVQTFGFHQDSGVQRDIHGRDAWIAPDQSHPIAPRMSVKAAYYLTDCSAVGCGNTWVVPGSHTQPHPHLPARGARGGDGGLGLGQPHGAIPVLAPANSVMIFDRRLLHAQSPNWSQAERLVVFVGYGYRWLKARDAMYVEPAFAAMRCPIARQLLGYTTQNSGLFHGNGLDMPLRAWLREHGCNEGLGFQLALANSDGRGTGHQPTSALDGEVQPPPPPPPLPPSVM